MTGNEYQKLAMRTNDGLCQRRLLDSNVAAFERKKETT